MTGFSGERMGGRALVYLLVVLRSINETKKHDNRPLGCADSIWTCFSRSATSFRAFHNICFLQSSLGYLLGANSGLSQLGAILGSAIDKKSCSQLQTVSKITTNDSLLLCLCKIS